MKIAISYRRNDVPGTSGRLRDFLTHYFKVQDIFFDISNIKSGQNFERILYEVFSKCNILLIVIGRDWLKDRGGNIYFENSEDWVKKEIVSVLERSNTLIVPILVDGAQMPSLNELPKELRPLLGLTFMKISNDTFYQNTINLVDRLKQYIHEMNINIETAFKPLLGYGIRQVMKDGMSENTVIDIISRAQSSVRICYTWTHLIGRCGRAIFDAVSERNVSFQLLLLNPESPFADQRGKDSRTPHVPGRIRTTVSEVRELFSNEVDLKKTDIRRLFQVKYYENLPYNPFIIVDDIAIIGFYPLSSQAHYVPHLIVYDLNSEFGRFADEQFDIRWKTSSTLVNWWE